MTSEEIKALAETTAAIVLRTLGPTSYNPDDMMTIEEAAKMLGMSKSYVYKLTSKREIPCYKPSGKTCYLRRGDIQEWMSQGHCPSNKQLSEMSQAWLNAHPLEDDVIMATRRQRSNRAERSLRRGRP